MILVNKKVFLLMLLLSFKSLSYYEYDASGIDQYGNDVYGSVDMNQYDKYGNGNLTITGDDGIDVDVDVDVEWTDYGVLEATDYNGNVYELETE